MTNIELLRATVNRLRREVYGGSQELTGPILDQLVAREAELALAERQAKPPAGGGLLFSSAGETHTLGAETTGLEAKCFLRMAQVPTAIAQLLDPVTNPLITCEVTNVSTSQRRVRVTAFVEGYSAQAIDTAEIKKNGSQKFHQLPTFFPDRLEKLHELTRATLHVQIDDLDGKVELHRTQAIWLLPRTTAPLAVRDPNTGAWSNLTKYLGAFVTPNAPAIETLLRAAVDDVPGRQFVSYQDGIAGVEPQVQALFEGLKKRGLRYVNSVLAFSPEDGWSSQRVRLPSQTLTSGNANCIDGTVLFASLLEAITLRPAIVVIPGHAFVGWQPDPDDPDSWRYLETTMIASGSFAQATKVADDRAKAYAGQAATAPLLFQRWALPELRSTHGILPME